MWDLAKSMGNWLWVLSCQQRTVLPKNQATGEHKCSHSSEGTDVGQGFQTYHHTIITKSSNTTQSILNEIHIFLLIILSI